MFQKFDERLLGVRGNGIAIGIVPESERAVSLVIGDCKIMDRLKQITINI